MRNWSESELAADVGNSITNEKNTIVLQKNSEKKAASRAMKLLLYKMRTERELRDRLTEEGYESADIETAMRYCSSFGYVNDGRYAENYVMSMARRKSIRQIQRDLQEKGVDECLIEEALETCGPDESEIVYALVCRKSGHPHQMEEKELRRTYAFLARKGFSSGVIWQAIHRFQEEDEG